MRTHFLRRLSLRLCRLSIVFAALTLSGCGKEEKRVEAALTTGDFRWASFPVALRADEALLDGGWAEDDLLAAIQFWEKKAGRTLFTLNKWRTGDIPYYGDPSKPTDIVENVIFLQSPWPHEKKVAGKTFFFANGNTIQKAAIFINAHTDLCRGSCYNEPTRTSRRKLLAHELGHFLGFVGHSGALNDIMYPEILPGGSLEDLTVDEALLRNLVP